MVCKANAAYLALIQMVSQTFILSLTNVLTSTLCGRDTREQDRYDLGSVGFTVYWVMITYIYMMTKYNVP